jgi:phosphoribulokinase
MNNTRPLLLGIVGESAAGKTTLARGVVRLLGTHGVTPVCLDDYHRYSRAERAQHGLAASDPAANHLAQMAADLAALRAGQVICKPIYDHRQGVLREPEIVAPLGLVIAYGMLTLTPPELADLFDLTIYLDPAPELLARWRLSRDVRERGYSVADVVAGAVERRTAAARFIQPQRRRANLVIRFQPTPDDRLAAELWLRRALPQPVRLPNIEITPDVSDADDCTSTRIVIRPEAASSLLQAQAELWATLPNAPTLLTTTTPALDPVTTFVQAFVAWLLLHREG